MSEEHWHLGMALEERDQAQELDALFDVVKQRESMRSTTKMIRELVDIASAALRAANQLAREMDHAPTDAEVLNA